MKDDSYVKGILFLILAQMTVGVNIVASKILLPTIPVLLLLVLRFALATLILLPLHWATSARQHSIRTHLSQLNNRDWRFILAQALSAGFLFNCLALTGLRYTDANVAGIITSALPAIIILLSWIVLNEKISAHKALCIGFASAGLVIIAYDKLTVIGPTHSFFGDLIVLISLLPEASYYVLCKMYNNRLPIFLTSALINGINAVLLFPAVLLIHWEQLSISLAHWFIIVIIGLSSGLFYVFWFMGARMVDTVMSSLSTAIMPVSTVILAWLVLHEQLSLPEFFGMALVIFSIVLYARR